MGVGQRHLDDISTDSVVEIVTAMGILKSKVSKPILEVRHLIADAVILQLPKITLHAKQLLPEYSGIYYVLDESNNVWYIGQAKISVNAGKLNLIIVSTNWKPRKRNTSLSTMSKLLNLN